MKVVIIGAGFGGIGAAIELRRHGFDEITILDRAPEVGGTWWYNTYPGLCDVPSYLYSYSFAQRRDWSRMCSPHDEILSYLQGVARDQGVDRLFGAERRRERGGAGTRPRGPMDRDERGTAGAGRPTRGDRRDRPAAPARDARASTGSNEFAGHSFHSSRWDHDYDLRGKRVAVDRHRRERDPVHPARRRRMRGS